MVAVNYVLGIRKNALKFDADEPRFMVLNKNNCFFTFSEKTRSRYDGFLVKLGNNLIKVVDEFTPEVGGGVLAINHAGYKVEVVRANLKEEFFLPEGYRSFAITPNHKIKGKLWFDVKGIFDNDEWGRNYRIVTQDPITLIEFTKSNGQLTLYIAVSATLKQKEEWREVAYKFDQARNSPPFSRYVYSPGIFESEQIIVSVGGDPEDALKENQHVKNNLIRLKAREKEIFFANVKRKGASEQVEAAFNLSRYYLTKLASANGVIAGLPWFSEIWSRDELISFGGLLSMGMEDYVKPRLLHYLDVVQQDGRLATREGAPENNDSAGWLFKRTLDFYLETKNKSKASKFSQKELELLLARCQAALSSLNKYFTQDGLVVNQPGETWMDSLPRSRARIEIQALRLPLLEILRLLTKDTVFVKKERELAELFKSKFLVNDKLIDGPDDHVIRPNIFIAAYTSQKLLTQVEWRKAFIKAFHELWNDWGGLATIEKSSGDFHAKHSGEDSSSYHNGDSWFFLNNMAALTLRRMEMPGFSLKISKILEASTKEILSLGCLGCAGELSSSAVLESRGAWLQAWSCGTYIELVEEMFEDV